MIAFGERAESVSPPFFFVQEKIGKGLQEVQGVSSSSETNCSYS